MTDISPTTTSPLGMAPEELDGLASKLEVRFSADFTSRWSDLEFEELALHAFNVQFQHNPVYRRFCEGKNAVPTSVTSWQQVPMVPTTAFRYLDLVTGDHSSVRMVFRTSGTTSTTLSPGRHLVSRPSLYHASLLSNFREHLLPDAEKIKFISLIPSPAEMPHSSLSYMVGVAADTMSSEVQWFVDGGGVLNSAGLIKPLNDAALAGEEVLLLGTAFAFVHWLDELAGRELRRLPPVSRIMETGGFKARARDITKEQLYKSLSMTVGLETNRIVNEYGMPELLSQLYESHLTQPNELQEGHAPPPWLRVRALNPTTLEPVAENETGILAFFDLANLGSVCHVLTEDIGQVIDGRIHLEGRFPGAEPRGCSRAMDELMTSSQVTRR